MINEGQTRTMNFGNESTGTAEEVSYVTQEELQELKAKVNKSMAELVKLVLKGKRELAAIEERLENYNKRGGHRI